MKASRFFRLVWRFNALALAAVAVVALLLGGYGLAEVLRHETRQIQAINITPAPEHAREELEIGAFTPLAPGPVLWAPVTARVDYALGRHSKQATSVRNYLFYDTEQRTSWRLLPDNRRLVLSVQPLRTRQAADWSAAEPTPAHALAVSLGDRDTNGDGLLTRNDDIAFGMARPDGTDFKRLEIGPGQLATAHLASETEAVLIVARPDGAEAVHVALPDARIVARHRIDAGLAPKAQ